MVIRPCSRSCRGIYRGQRKYSWHEEKALLQSFTVSPKGSEHCLHHSVTSENILTRLRRGRADVSSSLWILALFCLDRMKRVAARLPSAVGIQYLPPTGAHTHRHTTTSALSFLSHMMFARWNTDLGEQRVTVACNSNQTVYCIFKSAARILLQLPILFLLHASPFYLHLLYFLFFMAVAAPAFPGCQTMSLLSFKLQS